MKIMNINNIEEFFKVVDSCDGKVELVTDEGDRLNLKSKLTQYLSLAELFSGGKINEVELIAHEPGDYEKLIKYVMREV